VKVLEAVPAIFTKDKAWAGRQLSFILRPGSIVVLPEDAINEIQNPKAFHIDRQWLWRPIGNEDLVVLGSPYAFQKPVQLDGSRPLCGVVTIACGIGMALIPSFLHAS